MAQNAISVATIRRLPIYLDYLKAMEENTQYISATSLAAALGLGEVQVRKDLSSVCSSGRPRVGYHVAELREEIEKYLGYHNTNNAIIIGAGKLGCALLGYDGFSRYGLHILAAFDTAPEKVGRTESGKPIYDMKDLARFCREEQVHIGIITVPVTHAKEACDAALAGGILAIWNFAPVKLDVPAPVIIKNENMASSLAILSTRLAQRLESDDA